MIKGIDILGLAHKNVDLKAVIKEVPKGWAIGAFDDPFGPVLKRLRKVLASGKFPVVRIHAHWDNKHKIAPIEKLKKKLPSYEKLAQDFSSVRVLVSHSCEYSEFSKAKVQERIDLIKQFAPSCEPVNSCMEGEATQDAFFELHGNGAAGVDEIISLDGLDFKDVDMKRWMSQNKKAHIVFGWRSEFNLRKRGESNPPPPRLRKVKCGAKEIREVVQAMK